MKNKMANCLAIDTNLLILLVVGLADRRYISEHKRCATFDAQDFDVVTSIVSRYEAVMVSPHVLTETSNLLRNVKEPICSAVSAVFASLVQQAQETYADSKKLVGHSHFVRLGLTDVAVLEMLSGDVDLLTVDVGLYLQASRDGHVATNYRHIQELRKDFQ